jgi:anti-sigma B factor antagonist
MAASSHHRWLQIEPVGEVVVATFTEADILDLDMIRGLGDQLLGLADDEGRRIVLDFQHVSRLSTALLGKVVALQQRLKKLGGRLALCQVAPHLKDAMNLLKIPQLVPIYKHEQEALEKLEDKPKR